MRNITFVGLLNIKFKEQPSVCAKWPNVCPFPTSSFAVSRDLKFTMLAQNLRWAPSSCRSPSGEKVDWIEMLREIDVWDGIQWHSMIIFNVKIKNSHRWINNLVGLSSELGLINFRAEQKQGDVGLKSRGKIAIPVVHQSLVPRACAQPYLHSHCADGLRPACCRAMSIHDSRRDRWEICWRFRNHPVWSKLSK